MGSFRPAVAVGLALVLAGSACQQQGQPSPAPPLPTSLPGASGPTATGPLPLSTSAQASAVPAGQRCTGELAAAVRDVTDRVRPAVVQITNEQVSLRTSEEIPAGVGSGVIFDQQGRILTNNHVIAGAQKLRVTLPDDRSFEAKLVGADPKTDLAVVQISAQQLPVATLGDANTVAPGDWVVAIGNALALPGGPTVTAGVVSAVHRTLQEPSDPQTGESGPFLFDLIQTDAAINPGNSGGPLVDLCGRVVGVNTLVRTEAAAGVPAQGIGFAISIATAKPIADQLVARGRATHAFLGIRYGFLTPAGAAQLRLPTATRGAVIGAVSGGTPAEQAGLRTNDVITAIDGKPIDDESALAKIVDSRKPGDTVTLTVLRPSSGGPQALTLRATLTELP